MIFCRRGNLFILLLLLSVSGRAYAGEMLFPPLTDSEDWAGTYFKNKKLGFSYTKTRVADDSVTVNSRIYMRVKSAGAEQVTSFSQESVIDKPSLGVKRFSLLQEIMGHRQKVEGRVENGELVLDVFTLGYHKTNKILFPKDTALASAYYLNIIKGGLQVGSKGAFAVFIEPMLTMGRMEYEVLRKEKIVFDGQAVETFVLQERLNGLISTAWVDEKGTVLREASEEGFESRRETEKVAQSLPDGAISMSSFITLSLVKPRHDLDRPRALRQLRVKLSNIGGNAAIPADQRQTVSRADGASIIQVKIEPQAPVRPVAFPVKPFADAALVSDAPEIQSNHPRIRALARELVKGKTDAWQAALAINRWVYDHIDKVLVDTFTALDTLRERRGECQSHTNLFAALARAAGIPARVVNGLVYSEEYRGFLYHAWPEVYVGEWRALDPTFGQENVDATHIKLALGTAEGQIKLLDFIGRVEIDVLDQ